ncbi:MAG: SGNH/GDSL hydrolase family protein [Clostridia bacterium]|nr:SGNH/GDSL hydrolase family protein [Clostridia bacterium]
MKRVFLIGDSICGGYNTYVQKAYEGIAEVRCTPESGRFASYLVRVVPDWARQLKGDTIDLVHWNAGLWDVLRMPDGECFSDIDTYKRYMERLCVTLKRFFPNAKFVFATSTHVLEWKEIPDYAFFYRFNRDIEAYNAAAVEIVTRHGMAVNDLYTLSKSLPDSAHSDETHYYTKEGTQAFTDRVLSVIADVIGEKANPLDYDALFTEVKEVHGV